jgi:ATP-dependent DNA helicase 2 subunit 1
LYSHRKTNRVTQIYSKETGEIVSKERIRHYTEFGGEHVQISRDEVADIKKRCNSNPNQASLLLLGFKPLPKNSEAIANFTLVDKSTFAYPNDDFVRGSKAAFATLHASMIRKKVMGIGELLLRVTAMSRLVAIVPEEGSFERISRNEDIYSQVAPPGFLLIPLAFEDDIKALPRKHDFVADKDMVNAAIDLIRHQDIGDSIEIGQSFENPALKTFWNYIESLALGTSLEEEYIDDDDDDTKMNVQDILANAGDQIEAFRNTIPEDEVKQAIPRKRKVIEPIPDETGIDWLHEHEMDTFHELRVDELKAYLRSYGERVGGRKSEIISRIKIHIQNRLGNNK